MIPEDVVQDLKKKHGTIFAVPIRGEDYVFRALTLGEFAAITTNKSGRWQIAEAEDDIVTTALVWPEHLTSDDLPAGLISSLAEEILEASGFDDDIGHLNSVLEEKRQETESFQTMMKAFIIAAMPKYTDEDLDSFTFNDLLSKLALAEAVFRVQKDVYNPQIAEIKLNVNDPNAPKEEPKAEPQADPIAEKLKAALPKRPRPGMKLPPGTRPDEVEIEYE